MAENGAELDLDADAVAAKPPRSWLKYIIIALTVSLLLSGAALAVLYFTGALSDGGQQAQSGSATARTGGKPTAHTEKKPLKPVKYIALSPPFLVNFAGGSNVRYLQVSIELSAYHKAVLDAVKQQMPAIRNSLLLLLSSQKPSLLTTRAGKEKLRAEVLATARKVLEQQAGVAGLQGAYFTSFVMQ